MGENTLSGIFSPKAYPWNADKPFSNRHPNLEYKSRPQHSITIVSNFLFSDVPQTILNVSPSPGVIGFKGLFPSPPGGETKNDTYSSFDFDTQILLNEIKIIIFQAVIKRCWRKQSVTMVTVGPPSSLQLPPQPHFTWGETATHCVFSFCDQHHLLNHQSRYPHPPPLHLHRHW